MAEIEISPLIYAGLRRTDWLWPNWLAEGMLHVLAGEPGVGKSTIAITAAAIVSRGMIWPDGTKSPKGEVLIWSGDDDIAKTVQLRAARANAHAFNIHVVTCVRDGANRRSPFDPSRDMGTLCKKIKQMPGIKLVVLDPILGDDYRTLRPLVSLAGEQGFAILAVTYFNKTTPAQGALGRSIDDVTFGAQARVVWVATEDEKAKQYALYVAKSSVGPRGCGWRYKLGYGEGETRQYFPALFIGWQDEITMPTFALLSEKASAISDAKSFLREILSDGPIPQNIIEEKAKIGGFVWQTVLQAKDELGIKLMGGKPGIGGWIWDFPIKAAEE